MSQESAKKNSYTANYLSRYSIVLGSVGVFIFGVMISQWLIAGVGFALLALGIMDIVQSKRAILHNYPIAGHIRFMLERFRPEIRQYFLEDDKEKVPFSRQQRSLVYRRAKEVSDTEGFGSLSDWYDEGREWFLQSNIPKKVVSHDFRITVGNEECSQPYSASVFNISAMSFGSLSANAIMALNKGAKLGGFYHDTGEGSMSRYHEKYGGDLVFQIGTGYFGCRDANGNFDAERFKDKAINPQVKMIEIKLSQGAKPGKGGMLPAGKITAEIAKAREIPEGVDCISPSYHSAFKTPLELVAFWQQIRELSGGKPVGIKLCIGQPWQFMAIVKAMLQTKNYPDFIVVDGAEGGTGAAPVEFMDHVGMPLHDGFLFVNNTLVGAGIRDHIKIGVSGKIISAFDVARMLALGADWCNSARGFMFAIGCIQSRSCHTDACPTGVATQNPYRQKALNVENKSDRVKNYHQNTLKALAGIVGAVGCNHPSEIMPHHIARREHDGQIKLLSKHYFMMDKNALLDDKARADIYNQMWDMACADSFEPVTVADIAYNKDSRNRSQRIDTVSL